MVPSLQGNSQSKEARQAYNILLQKGKELGLEEATQVEPVRLSEKERHDIEELETVDATVPKNNEVWTQGVLQSCL